MQPKKECNDSRPRFTLSSEAMDRLRMAVKQHNDQLPAGATRRTCSDLVEQLVLDNVQDNLLLKMQRLREVMLQREASEREAKTLQLDIKKLRAKRLNPGGERDLVLDDIEKLQAELHQDDAAAAGGGEQ